jgi:2-dehydro-3-deoxyphosphogluconate aldolase/(4S)-4-hydroxy-2-oxoglutarate aldolase
VLQTIRDIGIIPVVRAESAVEAMKAIDAIREGGISILEITMTVPGAVGVIEEVSQALRQRRACRRWYGARRRNCAACILAGAQFVVSPSLNLETIEVCRSHGIAVMPGALTPTEVVQAWSRAPIL